MKNFKVNPTNAIMYTFALVGPLSTTFLDSYNLIFCVVLFLFLFFLISVNKKKIHINKTNKIFIFSYLSFSLIALFSTLISLPDITSENHLTNLLSRLSTISLTLIILICISVWIHNQEVRKLLNFLKFAFFSTIIFAAIAIYQILAYHYNLPFIETRSYIYGTSYEIQQSLGIRITSLAREPNFYAPILIESFLLSFLFLKRSALCIYVIFSIFLIYKTHSTGAYIHFTLISILLFIFLGRNKLTKLITTIILLISLFFLIYYLTLYDNYFTNKLLNEINGESSRTLIYSTIIYEIFNSNFLHLLFGHGVNTLQLFNELATENYNINFSVSNSLYIDILWDSGLIGLICFSFGFFLLFLSLKRSARNNKYGTIALFLFLNLLITSIYRSEYTTTHFSWISSIIFVCYQLANPRDKNEAKHAIRNT
ncbi:O-antigen ligase family protein [Providencia rettgeri]|nr:O-antigen ligase family protein [Providencia rettgeri]MBQ0351821.1 O-antigen ligase family protein [Providencia rettgeri]MBQ0405074.1 O-antigen ligase family protein [Providencia rettgeri]